jgi:hypothetical protein
LKQFGSQLAAIGLERKREEKEQKRLGGNYPFSGKFVT